MLFKRKKKSTITPGDRTVPRIYGHDKTIHRTTQLDVEVDKNGEVVAVWFRCQPLPFRQSNVDDWRAKSMRAMPATDKLLAVELEERDRD